MKAVFKCKAEKEGQQGTQECSSECTRTALDRLSTNIEQRKIRFKITLNFVLVENLHYFHPISIN